MGMQLSIDQIPEDTKEPVEVERRETLVETQSACGAALDILNELLLFDKLETGALVLHKQSVPVTELVEDSVRMFSAQAREKSIELSITNNDETMLMPTVEGTSEVPLALCDTDEVSVDKNKVVQVIRNVVSNAIKFTPTSGKIQVNVKFEQHVKSHKCMLAASTSSIKSSHTTETACDDLEGEMVSGEVVIEVRDSGAGISEENQKRLFKEVVQFNPELLQNGGGSGLGMCISKGIMDMHGGGIGVRSSGEGHGSVFTLRLPMTRSKELGESRVYSPAAFVASLRKRSSIRSLNTGGGDQSPGKTAKSNKTIPLDQYQDALQLSECSSETACSSSRSSLVPTERLLRFLVVDDSKMNRKMLCRLLKNKGHECVEAEDGVQAVAKLSPVVVPRCLADTDTESTDGNTLAAQVSGPTDAPAYDAILMDFM